MTTANEAKITVRTMAVFSSANFGVNMVNALSNTALPLYLAGYGLPAWLIGVLSQERSSLGGIEQPLIGLLSDRTRTRLGKRRPFFVVGVALVALSLIFLSTHPPFWAVAINLTVFASFLAVANDPYQALMADLFPPAWRGRIGAALGLANMAGQVVFFVVSFLVWERNEALAFYIAGAGLVISFAITFFGIREPEVASQRRTFVWKGIGRYAGELLAHREFGKYSLSQLFFWFGIGGAVPFLTRFAVLALGVSESESYLFMLVAVLSTFVFTTPAGILGDRLGKKRVLAWGLVAYAAITIVGSQAQDPFQGAVVMGLVGVANAMTTTLSFPLFADMMPRGRIGEFTGFAAFVTSIAQAIGAALVGAFVDVSGNFRVAFVASGVLIAISFFLLRLVEPEKAHLASTVEGPLVGSAAGGEE